MRDYRTDKDYLDRPRWSRLGVRLNEHVIIVVLIWTPLKFLKFFVEALTLLFKAAASPNREPKGLIVDWLTPPDYAEEALVNILERYNYWVEKHGRRWAKIIFHTQCVGAVLSCWVDWAMKRLKLLNVLRPSP